MIRAVRLLASSFPFVFLCQDNENVSHRFSSLFISCAPSKLRASNNGRSNIHLYCTCSIPPAVVTIRSRLRKLRAGGAALYLYLYASVCLLQALQVDPSAVSSGPAAPIDAPRLLSPSDLTTAGSGGGDSGREEQRRRRHRRQLPTSITSSDDHQDDRTRSFQLAHNIHILPHLPKYSIIIQKKSNELLGKSCKGSGRTTYFCVTLSVAAC